MRCDCIRNHQNSVKGIRVARLLNMSRATLDYRLKRVKNKIGC
ncbi:helix-turn-helix domain-containing protein [Acinetobacter silvestris]